MLENFKSGIQLAPTTRFKDLDDYFRWKKGDITLCVGYGNHGKTYFMLQLMLTKSIWDGWKWGVFSPENYPANDFYDDLIEMYCGKSLEYMNEHEYSEAAHFINDHIFYVYPEHQHDINSIHEKFRYLVMKKGIDGVLIDPFNQLDHTQKPFQRDDMYLSDILKDMKRFALLNNIVYTIISHPKNPSYKDDKSLPIVDMYDIHGGSMWGNKSDQILSYYRPNWHIDKNSPQVQIYIQKLKRKRTGGKLGSVDMTLLWSRKRYTEDISQDTPCDPTLLKQGKQMEIVHNNWLPYKDDSEDVTF
jgi:twinkle protein